MRAFLKAAIAVPAVLGLFLIGAALFGASPSFADQAISVITCPTVPAADTTTACAPAGDWIGDIAVALPAVLASVIFGIVIRFLPVQLRALLTAQRTAQVEQLLERALGAGAAKLQDSLKGKGISVDVKNHFIATGLQYAIDHGPAKLLAWMGGTQAIIDKLTARLVTSPAVTSVTTPAAAQTTANTGTGLTAQG